MFNEEEILQDQVDYDADDWAACADGKGPTLALVSPELDNNLPESWTCYGDYGSPNEPNSPGLSVAELVSESFIIYPNPVGNLKTLYIKGTKINKVEIYSILGKKLLELHADNSEKVVLNIDKLTRGVYVLNVNSKSKSKLIIR